MLDEAHLVPPFEALLQSIVGRTADFGRHVDEREVVNGLMYVLSSGCQWRAVPKDLPPRSTLYDYFDRWSWDGTLDRIHDALYVKCREAAAREASPTAAIIDSQSLLRVVCVRSCSPRPASRRRTVRLSADWDVPSLAVLC